MKTTQRFLSALALLAPLSAGAFAQAVISEFRVDQPGTDNDEYFELAGVPLTALTGVTYLVVGDGAGASGVIESVTDLSAATIQADGLLLVTETTYTAGGTPDLMVGATGLNFENTDNVTHMLVTGFTGANGQDLDTNDDGVFDVTPWTGIIDSVALVALVTGGDLIYSTSVVGPDGNFGPGHAFRCADWRMGGFTLGTHDTPDAAVNCNPSTFCIGESNDCPCANGGSNDAGCNLGQATGGILLVVNNYAPDGLGGGTADMDATGFNPAGQPTAVLIRSVTRQLPAAFGDGILCLGGTVTRINSGTAIGGALSIPISHGAGAGGFSYQLWGRALPAPFCTPDGFNLSNGVQVDW